MFFLEQDTLEIIIYLGFGFLGHRNIKKKPKTKISKVFWV
jgi:hypothetical protein